MGQSGATAVAAHLVVVRLAGPIAPRRCLHFDPFAAIGVAVVFASASGDWNGSFALPNQPSLIGLDLVAQALFVEPAAALGFDVGDAHWCSLGF